MAYATLADLKSYLAIAEAGDDSLLEALLARATRLVEAFTGRIFRSVPGTRCHGPEALDRDVRILRLDGECVAVQEVRNGDSARTVIPATEYILLPRNRPPYAAIRLKQSARGWEWATDGWVEVTALWGFSSQPPEDVVQATIRLAAFLYRQRDAQVFDVTAEPALGTMTIPQGLPRDVRLILDLYRRRT